MMHIRLSSVLAALTACLAVAAPAMAHEPTPPKAETRPFPVPPGAPGAPDAASDPPLWDNLGTLHFAVTTSSPRAQQYFDQGLRLTYAFNHAEARRAFQAAQRLDPGCAMCAWGEALVLGPNINAPMDEAALKPTLAALARARTAAPRATAKERALVEALAARYSGDPAADRGALNAAYAGAMERVTARFPGDADVAVLTAEALMNLSPWDYWEDSGRRPKGRTATIVSLLERVLAANPDHPGAIHYYIHTVEASSNPDRAERHAERLAAAMPGAGHLVHMPSHIYYRVGRYRDSLAANKRAMEVDEAYIASVSPSGIYPSAYYPHNVHFLMVSAQMAGDAGATIEAATKLGHVISDEAMRAVPWLQPVKAAPFFAHAQFSAPETILALGDPGTQFPFVRAMWHYARGVAQAARGSVDAAQVEADAIAALEREADLKPLTAGGVPADTLLTIAREIVLARTAQARSELPAAITHFRRAAELQDGLPYMEPPFWYYPIRQSLGAALLQAGRAEEAEREFTAALGTVPRNGWVLYGLAETYRARGNHEMAGRAEAALGRVWAGERATLSLPRL